MDNISFTEWQKVDIRVAEVMTVAEIPGADRLYQLTVKLGEETRQLVAGIKLYYQPAELIGKKVLVLANLEPRAIRGITSHGMILCASTEDKLQVVYTTVEKEIAPGTKVM